MSTKSHGSMKSKKDWQRRERKLRDKLRDDQRKEARKKQRQAEGDRLKQATQNYEVTKARAWSNGRITSRTFYFTGNVIGVTTRNPETAFRQKELAADARALGNDKLVAELDREGYYDFLEYEKELADYRRELESLAAHWRALKRDHGKYREARLRGTCLPVEGKIKKNDRADLVDGKGVGKHQKMTVRQYRELVADEPVDDQAKKDAWDYCNFAVRYFLALAELVRVEKQAIRNERIQLRDEVEARFKSQRNSRKIREFSRRSQNRLRLTVNSLDYSPMWVDGWVPGFLTLTLPGGDWAKLTPNRKAWNRLIDNLRKRFERKWGRKLWGVWKLEFQNGRRGTQRGAPHIHALVAMPSAPGEAKQLERWMKHAWSDICGVTGTKYEASHLKRGTWLREWEGEPENVGAYFLQEVDYGNKVEQHIVPKAWCDDQGNPEPGNWWDVWGRKKLKADLFERPLTDEEAKIVYAILAKHEDQVRKERGQENEVKPLERVDLETGEIVTVEMLVRYIVDGGAGYLITTLAKEIFAEVREALENYREENDD